LVANHWFGGWFLTLLAAGYWYCWLTKMSLLTSELEKFQLMKLWAIVSGFQQKKPELIWTSRIQDMSWKPNNVWAAGQIWTSRIQDMSWKPNSVWAAGQILTSPLLLRFELENSRIESWTPHESFRSMS